MPKFYPKLLPPPPEPVDPKQPKLVFKIARDPKRQLKNYDANALIAY